MVKVNPSIDAIVGNSLASHYNGIFQTHIVDARAGKLQQNGRLCRLRSTHNRLQGLEVIEVGGKHSTLALLATFEQFFYIHCLFSFFIS